MTWLVSILFIFAGKKPPVIRCHDPAVYTCVLSGLCLVGGDQLGLQQNPTLAEMRPVWRIQTCIRQDSCNRQHEVGRRLATSMTSAVMAQGSWRCRCAPLAVMPLALVGPSKRHLKVDGRDSRQLGHNTIAILFFPSQGPKSSGFTGLGTQKRGEKPTLYSLWASSFLGSR